jgi:H+/gluconate symporter-like permease
MSTHIVGLLGILIALGLLIFLAFRGFTLLLAAPAAAIVAAAFSGEPLLAKWTITFMQGTARFIANFFPLFLLGGVFGKLMDDSGAALSIARGLTERLGNARAVMAVVLACAALTYGGVSLFVVAFAVFPVADALFRQAEVPHRLIPAAIALGAFYLHDDGLARHPRHPECDPDGVFRHDAFRSANSERAGVGDHPRLRPVVAARDGIPRPPRR